MVNAVEYNLAVSESLEAARNIVEAIIKARKILRMYPRSNPVYVKNLENTFNKFKDYFNSRDNLTFRFGRNDIYYDSESVYNNLHKQDNLAFIFFKDGMREITFNNDVTCDEIEDFLGIIAADFDRDAVEDDIVTLFWQRDFANIKYLAEDIILSEEEIDSSNRIIEIKQRSSDTADLKRAYDDSSDEDEIPQAVPIIPLTADDYKHLLDVLAKDDEVKLPKLFYILFELYYDVDRSVEYEDMVYFFMKAIEHSIKNNCFSLMIDVISKLKQIIGNKDTDAIMRKSAIKIILFVSGKKMISIIGDILEKEDKIEKEVFQKYICSLDQNAIAPLVDLLGYLQSSYARSMTIDALTSLVLKKSSIHKISPKDISALIKGLNHPEWQIISKIIYILSLIGDRNAIEHIKKSTKHEDFRVRLAAVKALGELGGDNVLNTIQECLNDNDRKVVLVSLESIRNIATDSAKRIIMEQITKKSFIEKEFNEKKIYFGILAQWNDKKTYDFCIQIIKKKSFWKKSKHDETKACAAYSLGLIGNKSALPILNKYKTSRNRLVREYFNEAIRRIESDG